MFPFVFTDRVSQINDKVYLGNEAGSKDIKELQANGITHILVAAKFLQKHFPEDFTYKQFDLLDFPSCDIKTHFQDAIQFMKQAGKVFVHCAAGVSRSTTLVIAYLMQEEKMTLDDAHDLVKSKRSCIYPNEGFRRQLREFEKELNAKWDKEGVKPLSKEEIMKRKLL